MKKRTKFLCLVVASALIIGIFAYYLVRMHWGPHRNDVFAVEQMTLLQDAVLAGDIPVLEASSFVGVLDNGDFSCWVGVAVHVDLSADELNGVLSSIIEQENVEILPYNLAVANKLHFSGIQKEVEGMDTEGYFIIGVVLQPPTRIDFRNKR